MKLLPPPKQFTKLFNLVQQFNTVHDEPTPEDAHLERIFWLQKIIFELNQIDYNQPDGHALFLWSNSHEDSSIQTQLDYYGINPHGSFYLQAFQFAKAVSNYSNNPNSTPDKLQFPGDDEYDHIQSHNELVKSSESFESINKQFVQTAWQIFSIINQDQYKLERIRKNIEILKSAQKKIKAIINISEENSPLSPMSAYVTTELGQQVNNHNYRFKMGGWEQDFVWRVEDREGSLESEQKLNSFPIARHFVEDYGLFRMVFKTGDSSYTYRPVILSQYARQGSLHHLAQSLQNENIHTISSNIHFFFTQLTLVTKKMMAAGYYHPDIKLTNFLVDGNRILISDRKTLLNNEKPKISTIASSPLYAPPEFLDCLNKYRTGFKFTAYRKTADMKPFMAYQIGMALKEFLVLSQQNELPEDFDQPHFNPASCFERPNRTIKNFALLSRELTRHDPKKRFPLDKLHQLLFLFNQNPIHFNERLNQYLSTTDIGIEQEIKSIQDNKLLESELPAQELLEKASLIFDDAANNQDKDPRVSSLLEDFAEKLAGKCFKECSESFFSKYFSAIKKAVFNYEWNQAPWYRKLLHVFTFGGIRVPKVQDIDFEKITINLPLNTDEFHQHFKQLQFLPVSALKKAFGKVSTNHFESFMISHVKDIFPEEPIASEPKASTSLPSKTIETSPNGEKSKELNPSESVIIKPDSNSSIIIHDDPMASVIFNDTPEKSVQFHPDLVSSVIFRTGPKNSKAPEEGSISPGNKNAFFQPQSPQAANPQMGKIAAYLNRVGSYGRSMKRGDKPSVVDIFPSESPSTTLGNK